MICVKRFLAVLLSLFILAGVPAATGIFFVHAEEQSEEVRLMADSSSGEKITVNLDIGEEVFYGSYHTRFYTVDGQTAYCLEPSKPWPSSGAYEAQRLEAGSLRKALYYLYGGPGYKAYVEKYGYFGFSGKMVKADEYCMSHCIAAYFYLENNNAFIGLSDEQIRGLKQKAANIRSLPEPPEYFNAFIFNTSGSRQVMGGTGKALTGSVEIYKKSGQPEWTDGSACYSLEGAVFGLFEPGKDTPSYRITTNRDGYGRADNVRIGKYEIRELESPEGYVLDYEKKNIVVENNQVSTYSCTDEAYYYPAELILQKADADTGKPAGQGSAVLSDALFTVRFYPGYYDMDPAEAGVKAARTWVMKSDSQGRVILSEKAKVSGDPFYQTASGENVLPLGTVTFEETEAPEGYLLNEEVIVRQVTVSGSGQTDTVFQYPEILDQVIRGHIKIVKFREDADSEQEQKSPLPGIRFRITSKTTGKTTVIETDENGCASTDRNSEGGRNGLVYDTYTISEENAPEGFMPVDDFEVTIDEEGEILYYILENKQIFSPVKLIKKDSTTGKVIPAAGAEFELLDAEKNPLTMTAHYPSGMESHTFSTDENGCFILPEKLPVGIYYFREITAPEGYLLNEELLEFQVKEGHDWQEPVEVEFEDEPAMEKIRLKKTDAESGKGLEGVYFDIIAKTDIVTPDGTLRMKAGEKAGTMVTGTDGTACSEELFPGTYEIVETKQAAGYMLPLSPYEVQVEYREGKGVQVMIENNRSSITDTTAVWKKSGAKWTEAGEESAITDTVELEYLNKGEEYTLKGIVMDAATGEALLADGEPVEAEVRFTPRQSETAVEMEFALDSLQFAGKRLVIYEYLYLGDTLLSSHDDIEDAGQMVEIRERAEEAVKTGDEIPDISGTALMAASSAAAGFAVAGMKTVLRRQKRRGK